MKKKILALILSIIAGLLCFGNFIYKLMKFDNTDYMILFAGMFITAFGISLYFKKTN